MNDKTTSLLFYANTGDMYPMLRLTGPIAAEALSFALMRLSAYATDLLARNADPRAAPVSGLAAEQETPCKT